MIYQEGYVYHIKDEYFEKVQDGQLFPDISRLERIMLEELNEK